MSGDMEILVLRATGLKNVQMFGVSGTCLQYQ